MYKRIILKLSGEALAGDKEGVMYDNDTIFAVVEQIKSILDMGTQVALVIGGGNIWRGRSSNAEMDRTKADQIGMLATVMNAVYVADAFRQKGVKATVQTPIIIGTVTEQFSKEKAASRLEAGEVVIFEAGIGHPYLSTDTVTALRGAELEADILLFAKNVDGVYDSDPKTNPNAKKIDEIKCQDIIRQGLRVVDTSAASLCYEQKIQVLIFGLNEENSLMRAVKGEKIGTVVTVGYMSKQTLVYEEKMKKTLAALESDYSTIRVGRANPKVLDKITVDYYGTPTPINQVGNITVPEARLIEIKPWESSLLKAIEKAINTSDLGINPSNDGKVIRLVFPELTEERRKELTKEVKKKGEDSKVAIRNIRRDAVDVFKKQEKKGEFSEDVLDDLLDEIQKLTDKYIADIDKKIESKSKDILSV